MVIMCVAQSKNWGCLLRAWRSVLLMLGLVARRKIKGYVFSFRALQRAATLWPRNHAEAASAEGVVSVWSLERLTTASQLWFEVVTDFDGWSGALVHCVSPPHLFCAFARVACTDSTT